MTRTTVAILLILAAAVANAKVHDVIQVYSPMAEPTSRNAQLNS